MAYAQTKSPIDLYQDDSELISNPDEFRELSADYSEKQADLAITPEDLAELEEVATGKTPAKQNHSAHTVRLSMPDGEPHKPAKYRQETADEQFEIAISDDELAELEDALIDPELEEERPSDEQFHIIKDEMDQD